MHLNDRKEAFNQAYVRAIASVAGFICVHQDYDRDSVDISFKSASSPYVCVEAQLKATSAAGVVRGNEIHFPLPMKNYNDLRGDSIMPRILIVMILPDKHLEDEEECPERWINQTNERLLLQKCAYWINLKGMPDSANGTNVTVKIPMDEEHLFKPEVLKNLVGQLLAQRDGGVNA